MTKNTASLSRWRSLPCERVALPLALSIAALVPSMAWSDSTKAANLNGLNLPESWVENVVPTNADIAVWDGTVTANTPANQPSLGADQSWLGIRVGNVSGARNTAGSVVGILSGSSANTLTLGAGGIDMSSATQSMLIQSRILIGADQTWNIANANTAASPAGFNNGEDLSFSALALGVPMNLGGFTVSTAGAGAVTVTSGYTISNGTLNIANTLFLIQGGGSRLTDVTGTATFNVASGARLQFQSNSAAVASAGLVNLNGGILHLSPNSANAVTQSGAISINSPSTILVGNTVGGGSSTGAVTISGNISGSEALALNNTASQAGAILRLAGNNSGYTGTVTVGGTSGRLLRMTSATAGSAAATWQVNSGLALEVEGVAVSLGTLIGEGAIRNSSTTTPAALTVGGGTFSGPISNGVGPATMALTKTGPGTLTLTGANNYSGPTTVAGGTLLVTPAQTGGGDMTVADGAALELRRLAPAGSFNASTFTLGSSTGATLTVDLGGFGNPTTPAITAPGFAPSAGSTIKLLGNLVPGTFALVDYAGVMGGGGGSGLTLSVPFRVAAALQNNPANSSLDVVVSGVESPRWDGSVNTNWDLDPIGNGAQGTANWRTLTTNSLTRYIESPTGTDAVLFDDAATNPAPINLVAALAPTGVTLNNSTRDYTFSGFGSLTGPMALTKNGTRALTLANEAPYDFTGGTVITGGTVFLGDGITFGAGSLPGTIRNEAVLVLNHPEDFTFSNPVTGAGTLRKDQVNTATIDRNTVSSAPILVNEGVLRFSAGGNLSGLISGAGILDAGGGALEISGSTANVQTGPTRVSGGTLRLNKTAGVNAIGGDLTITGGGVLAILAAEQIPNTATITFNGSSGDSTAGSTATETVANVVVSASSAAGQFILRNNFEVTGLATLQNGILGVASSHSAKLRALEMSGGILRIAGSGGPSFLEIGAGGITASGGIIEVKFNTGNQDATLILGGNFTATGNVAINNAGYTGPNLNVITLAATRTFDIAEGMVTTVQPDFAGLGGLIKTGGGTLILEPSSSAAYTGDTVINGGVLDIRGAITGSNILVNAGTLAGSGSVKGGASGIRLNSGARLAPGAPFLPSALTANVTGSTFDLGGAVTSSAGVLEFDLETPEFSDRVVITGGALHIGSGVLEFNDFSFLPGFSFDPAGTYTLFDGDTAITGSLGAGSIGNIAGQNFQLELADSGKDLVLVSVPEPSCFAALLTAIGMLGLRRRRD